MSHHLSPLGALGRGLVAGAAGTAALTVSQLVAAKITGTEPPAAAGVVGKRVLEGVFLRQVPDQQQPAINQVVHWSYGTAWGGLYGIVQATLRWPPPVHGLMFGSLVGGVGTALLPTLQLMPPPWKVPPATLGVNTFHHLVYGVTTAAVFHALHTRLRG